MKAVNRFFLKNILFFILPLILECTIGCGEVRKGPYLIPTADNTEMNVLWQLSKTSNCTITWQEEGESEGDSAITTEIGSGENQHQHSHIINGLLAGINYQYQVFVGNDKEPYFEGTFKTAPADTEENLKFLAFGDSRTHVDVFNSVAEAMVDTFQTDSAFQTFVLATGDLVLANSEIFWDLDLFNPTQPEIPEMMGNIPFISCMGNHETYAGNVDLYAKYLPYPFETGGRYWSFDYGPAHVVMVDQYAEGKSGVISDNQLAWIESDLAATDKTWKFIVMHEPGYAAGDHADNPDVQNNLQPLCEEYDVAVVLTGHNHYYSRVVVNGVHHVTTGGGGADLYSPDTPEENPNITTSSGTHHFCRVEIEDTTLTFTAENIDGSQIESFIITK